MLTLAYGCGLRASEVVRRRACDIDSEQMIIRIVQAAKRLQLEMWLRCVCGLSLRAAMSSIIR
jgi:hypothetical protein